MQMNRKFLFTVDQLELIRRLRNSGLTKEQVLCAFDSFERLDSEVNPLFNIPMTLQALQVQALQRLVLTAPGAVGIGNNMVLSQEGHPQQQLQQLPPPPPPPPQTPQQLTQLQQQVLQKLLTQRSPLESVPQTLHNKANQILPDDGAHLKSISDSGTVTDNSNNSEDAYSNSGRMIEGSEEGEIDSDELKEFISQGEVACLEEIKDFILKHNIKQQQIAVLAGVSQPYVSRYLRADFNSMSDRSCRAIKKWYLAYRKNPMAIGVAANSAFLMNGNGGGPPTLKKLISQAASLDMTGLVSSPPASSELEVLSCPRRERFVFRPNHLQVLERFFLDDNYPSYDRREEIVKTCNDSTEELVGRSLTDREKVTVQIVSNWFANKRKDLKKLYKEEGLDASQVPMRSRGRPSHSNLDSSSSALQSVLDHQSQHVAYLIQSNGTFSQGQPSVDSLQVSGIKSDTQADTGHVDEAMALQYSVEMAAVNQAIMSLTGQKPISIKMEKADISEYLVGGRSQVNASAACLMADSS